MAARQGTRQLFTRAGEVLEAALAARPDIYEEATVCSSCCRMLSNVIRSAFASIATHAAQRKLISRATKGKDSMQSLLECALASPRITRLIAQEAGRIRTLDFRSCQQLSDAPLLNVLAACTQLQRFMVSYAPGTDNGKQITDESVLALAKHCPNLTEVVLQNCVNLTDNAVKYVSRTYTYTHGSPIPVPYRTVDSAVLAASARTLENLSLKGVPDVRLFVRLYAHQRLAAHRCAAAEPAGVQVA